ncbi:MAG: type II restriction endonuclease [Acidobacteriota bacterium]
MPVSFKNVFLLILLFFAVSSVGAQGSDSARVQLGSATAKNGFLNETEIAGKFNNWRTDPEAKTWLAFMGYKYADIESVTATKPHGQKADVEVSVRSAGVLKKEGISIKLVSGPKGFNQIDKRWLSHYVEMWKMPQDIAAALRLFVGEAKPERPGRDPDRTYLNELETGVQKTIVEFFSAHRDEIISDLFEGDGVHSAKWIMVAQRSSEKPRWVLRSIDYAKKFFGGGKIEITPRGNLKVGRITVQRKGGDGGRDTAKMLQFKIDPALLFEGT